MKGTPDAPQCGFSRAVCQILDVQVSPVLHSFSTSCHRHLPLTNPTPLDHGTQGVAPEKLKSFNCLADQELREGIKEYSEWPTIPQVYVKGEFVGGCDIILSSTSRDLSSFTFIRCPVS